MATNTVVPQGQYGVDAGNVGAFLEQVALSTWTLTDPSGAVDTITDGATFSDILTTATIGEFFLTTPLTQDFLGGSLNAGTSIISGKSLVNHVSGTGGVTEFLVGWSDNVDPNAGGAKWEAGGFKSSSGLWKPHTGDETDVTSGGGSFTAADPNGFYPMLNIGGRSESQAHAFLYDGLTTFRATRSNALGVRTFTPTHLMLRVSHLDATIRTFRLGVGFIIYPSVPSLTITAPA